MARIEKKNQLVPGTKILNYIAPLYEYIVIYLRMP